MDTDIADPIILKSIRSLTRSTFDIRAYLKKYDINKLIRLCKPYNSGDSCFETAILV